jgi:pimeloyl-ACP methyl ester carboxylesterase
MNDNPTIRIESLLSARLFMSPQRAADRLFFISNLSGQMSLYAMDWGGSVPEPLLPPHIALQNPILLHGAWPYYIYPDLDRILVMIDADGDENYQPMLIPIAGGFPEPAFGSYFEDYRVFLLEADRHRNVAYFNAQSRRHPVNEAYRADMATGELTKLGESAWGFDVSGVNADDTKVVVIDGYTPADNVVYLWTADRGETELLYGVPLEDREPGQEVVLNGIHSACFTADDRGLLFITALFDDKYGLGYMHLATPGDVLPVAISGIVHEGVGELVDLMELVDDRYFLKYNIDGVSWAYEGRFGEDALTMVLGTVVVGQSEVASPLTDGVLQAGYYDEDADGYAISFSTATSPSQLYTVDGGCRSDRSKIEQHTRERILGVPEEWLAPGEDASFESYDGVRVSARLYLPSEELDYEPPYPLVYYVHGGPQSQEKPDFTWFSIPLIQYLTLRGFAVFVPNVRGSSGYGLEYMKYVDRDWGGRDRLDHVYALQEVLSEDPRLATSRTGVVGRSYGGYMTLTLAGRHPELWSAAVDMFGPYDLLSFQERIPETWKAYFKVALGDPEADREFLIERSPSTHLDRLGCPLLVIQGRNDPRVAERESRDLVENLRDQGKQVEYLVFENEGHDVLKFENRVRCYNAITEFFEKNLCS